MKTNLLDSLIVLLSATTLSVFVLWAAGELLGLGLFLDVPEYLRMASANVFEILATGAGLSAISFVVRRQIVNDDDNHPPYILYILGLTLVFVLTIVILAKLVSAQFGDQNIDAETAGELVRMSRTSLEADHLAENEEATRLLIEGPFFSSSAHDSLILDHVSNYDEGDVIEFHHNQSSIGKVAGYRLSFLGVCRIPDSGKLATLLSSWPGTPTIPGNLVSVTFNNETDFLRQEIIFDVLPDSLPLEEFVLNCGGSTRYELALDEDLSEVLACECGYTEALKIDQIVRQGEKYANEWYDRLLHEWRLDDERESPDDLHFEYDERYETGVTYFNPTSLIVDGEFSSYVDQLERLPLSSGVKIVRQDSTLAKVVQITYSRYHFTSFQYLFASLLEYGWSWSLIYVAPQTSKGKSPARILGFVDPMVLRVEMCIEHCGYPGMQYGIVDIDLLDGMAMLIEETGTFFGEEPPIR